jgi:hypothetical protein
MQSPTSFFSAKIAAGICFISSFLVLVVAIRHDETHTILVIGAGVAVIVNVVRSSIVVAQHISLHRQQWTMINSSDSNAAGGTSFSSLKAMPAAARVSSPSTVQQVQDSSAPSVPVAPVAPSSPLIVRELQQPGGNNGDETNMPVTSVEERRLVLRLVLLIPIYGVLSFLALTFPKFSPIIEQLSEMYEGFTALAFFQLLLTFFVDDDQKSFHHQEQQQQPGTRIDRAGLLRYLSSKLPNIRSSSELEEQSLEEISEMREAIGMKIVQAGWAGMVQETATNSARCIFPLSAWVGRSSRFPAFLHMALTVYIGWSFVLLLAGIASFFCDCYGAGEITFSKTWLWIRLSRSLFLAPSVIPLLFFLVIVSRRLAHRSPVMKFITIKAIVFIYFWQGLLISGIGLHHSPLKGHIPGDDDANSMLNLFLLCFEMTPLSFVSAAVFPAQRAPLLVNPSLVGERRQGHWLAFLLTPQDVWRSAKLSWFSHSHS